jgi:hypothetical protein
MDRNVSIVLAPGTANYRKVAQKHWGLTDEQMKGMHVHHEPPRCKGGRDIPEHLYVCSPSMHANGWHDLGFWLETQRSAAAKQPVEVRRENGRKLADWNSKNRSKNNGNRRAPTVESLTTVREFHVHERVTERKIGRYLGTIVAESGTPLKEVDDCIHALYGRKVGVHALARLVVGERINSLGITCSLGLQN